MLLCELNFLLFKKPFLTFHIFLCILSEKKVSDRKFAFCCSHLYNRSLFNLAEELLKMLKLYSKKQERNSKIYQIQHFFSKIKGIHYLQDIIGTHLSINSWILIKISILSLQFIIKTLIRPFNLGPKTFKCPFTLVKNINLKKLTKSTSNSSCFSSIFHIPWSTAVGPIITTRRRCQIWEKVLHHWIRSNPSSKSKCLKNNSSPLARFEEIVALSVSRRNTELPECPWKKSP